jgi:hypothetical protein
VNLNDMYPSRFLKSADFKDEETKIFTIDNVRLETLGQGDDKETKPIVSFVETDKEFVLNKTNATTIAKNLTDDTDAWVGKRVALHVVDVQMRGEMVPAIRVKTKQPQAAPVAPPPLDDDIFADDPVANMNIGQGVKIKSKQPA